MLVINVHQSRRHDDGCLTFSKNQRQAASGVGRLLVIIAVGKDMIDGTCVYGEQLVVLGIKRTEVNKLVYSL